MYATASVVNHASRSRPFLVYATADDVDHFLRGGLSRNGRGVLRTKGRVTKNGVGERSRNGRGGPRTRVGVQKLRGFPEIEGGSKN